MKALMGIRRIIFLEFRDRRKTATKIIMEYQTIENAYAHASELKPPRASKNIQEFWEQAKMSKVLATIETHADFEFDIEKRIMKILIRKRSVQNF